MAKVIFTDNFNRALEQIEDHIFESTGNLESVNHFLDELDRVILFISHNPNTPAAHPVTGDQSWVMSDGRYRLFFKVVMPVSGDVTLFITHIIDNKQINLDVYPNNTLPTYEEE